MVLGPCGSHLGPKSPKSEKNMVRGYALGGPFGKPWAPFWSLFRSRGVARVILVVFLAVL